MFKNNFSQINFDRNTFIGFDQEEILKSETEDLLTIRRAVYGYLKSTKLKKRNANFMAVFHRLNKELVGRGAIPLGPVKDKKKIKKSLFTLIKKDCNPFKAEKALKTPSTQSIESISTFNEDITTDTQSTLGAGSDKNKFLNKKMSIDLEIPSFFNDKRQKTVETSSPGQNLNFLKKKSDSNSGHKKGQNFNSEKNSHKNNTDYISNKPSFTLDEGLKFPTYDHNDHFECELKEMEIRSAMFGDLIEDKNFILEDY